MESHAGYMGGLKRSFCAGCTLPYYATSSEEIIFHVSTRMPSRGKDIEQKVCLVDSVVISLHCIPLVCTCMCSYKWELVKRCIVLLSKSRKPKHTHTNTHTHNGVTAISLCYCVYGHLVLSISIPRNVGPIFLTSFGCQPWRLPRSA